MTTNTKSATAKTGAPKSNSATVSTGGANGGIGVIVPGKPLTNTAVKTPPAVGNVSITSGFGPFALEYLQFTNPKTGKTTNIDVNFRAGVNNVLLQKTIIGPSTLTIQMTDPNRQLIKSIGDGGIISQGTTVTIVEDGQQLNFVLVQFMKASDQIQLVFESEAVYTLRNQRGLITNTVSTQVTEFITGLATAPNKYLAAGHKISVQSANYATVWSKLVGNSKKAIVKVGLGRGTTADSAEDSWSAMSRIASGVGWRLWEDENIIHFGPDEYWLGLLTKNKQGAAVPPINQKFNPGAKIQEIKEFSDTVQLIDYDWDVGKPYAQATVTCMLDNWQFNLGEIVHVTNLGPGSGYWMVSGMMRDMYLPQASLTLQVPMPFSQVLQPTSAPLPGFPLITAKIV